MPEVIDIFEVPGNYKSLSQVDRDRLNTERRKKLQSLVDTLIDKDFADLNKNDPEYIENTKIRQHQRKVLSSLPLDFIETLTAHLKATYIDQSKLPNYNPEEMSQESIISGELFEQFIELEIQLFELDPNHQEHIQTKEQKEIAQKILTLMANPERYGFHDFPEINPDILEIIFVEDTFVIDISIEAKKHLDERALGQLKKFQNNLTEVCNFLNNIKDAEKIGLEWLGQEGFKIGVSDKYIQMIAVPRNVNLEYKKGNPFYDKDMLEEKSKELSQLINNRKKVLPLISCFSHDELKIVSKIFYAEVQKKLQKESI